MLDYQQDEGEVQYQETDILVREEDELPAKNARGGAALLEADRELLPENLGAEGKLIVAEKKVSRGSRDPQVRLAKFATTEAILILL